MAGAMTAKADQQKAPPRAPVSSLKPLPLSGDGVEDALAQRAAQGDAGAFDALVTLLGGRVYGVAFRLLQDRAEAEDLAQEVFVAL